MCLAAGEQGWPCWHCLGDLAFGFWEATARLFFQEGGHRSDHKHSWFIPSGLKALLYFQLIRHCFPHQISHKDTTWLGSWCWWSCAAVFCQGTSSPTHSPNFAVPHHISLGLRGTIDVLALPFSESFTVRATRSPLWELLQEASSLGNLLEYSQRVPGHPQRHLWLCGNTGCFSKVKWLTSGLGLWN